MKKNILYIQPYASHVGGVDTVLLQLVEGLDKERFAPYVVLPEYSPYVEKYEELGAKVIFETLAVFGKPTSWDYYFKNFMKLFVSITRLKKLVKKYSIDIIHSHKMELIGGNIVGKMLDIPTVQTIHELPRRPLLAYKFVGYLNHLFNDKVIVLCDRSKTMLEWGLYKSDKTIKIYNGIKVKEKAQNENYNLRRELGLSKEDKIVVTVARLSPMKGIEYLIEAAEKIQNVDNDIKFIIVGDVAFDREIAYKESLMEKVEEANMSSVVHFLGLRRDVPEILAQSDLFVLPSVYDIFPTVILEAMSKGLPVVATDVGGVPEMVRSNTGVIVPSEDSEKLAIGILDVFSKDFKELGRNGKTTLEKEFTQEKYVTRTVQVYESLMN
ncbi:glycosyltransferase family 4 protein [Bacillus sp. WLY-B-L8]|uniref:glycosyltransferase family 4 protein n=1 Tax=Bacillus multifaciens TaxID=3068506 RepID=UPI00274157B0|nr:glycosyltransferase family 4 protein [Bacillus sp. WLY-B-L8]MDP7978347.1 glycosyltransferase family 4 protein [Bacillus sp. WLY-B-L8]